MSEDLYKLAFRSQKVTTTIDNLKKQQKTLEQSVSLAKNFIEHSDEVKSVLDETQRRIHNDLVSGISNMLTHFLQAVMDDPDRRVVCTSEINRAGQSQVRFEIMRSDSSSEDVLEGNGGAVTNIISTGLRLISVMRAKRMRRFLVLDEPDCWLSPSRVPYFIDVLKELTQKTPDMPIQILLITHHNVEPDELISVVELKRKDGVLYTVSKIAQKPLVGQIESIELVNCRSHQNTVIQLGAGITILKGGNNFGKSVVVGALQALIYGGGRSDVIRHGCDSASIRVKIVDGCVIEYERQRKKTPRVSYRLFDTSDQLVHDDAGSESPSWMQDEKAMGIASVENIEIHIASQKSPIFLLQENASKQTALLCIGQEAQHIGMYLDRFQSIRKSKLAVIRTGEQQLESLRLLLERLEKYDGLLESFDALKSLNGEIAEKSQSLQSLENCLSAWIKVLPLQSVFFDHLPTLKEPYQVDASTRAIDQIRRLSKVSKLKLDQTPIIAAEHPASDVSRFIQLVRPLLELSKQHKLTEPPSVHIDSQLVGDVGRLAVAAFNVKRDGIKARNDLEEERAAYQKQQLSIKALELELKKCPLCSSDFAGVSHVH